MPPGHHHSFILHGLWPQHETGWPSSCRTGAAAPGRAQTAAMADIMGSPGLAWHQWQKHGRCSGLTAQACFDLSRRACRAVTIPPLPRPCGPDVARDCRMPDARLPAGR